MIWFPNIICIQKGNEFRICYFHTMISGMGNSLICNTEYLNSFILNFFGLRQTIIRGAIIYHNYFKILECLSQHTFQSVLNVLFFIIKWNNNGNNRLHGMILIIQNSYQRYKTSTLEDTLMFDNNFCRFVWIN